LYWLEAGPGPEIAVSVRKEASEGTFRCASVAPFVLAHPPECSAVDAVPK